MNHTRPQAALKQYSQVGVQSEIDSASPHRLIQMLLGGAMSRIATAAGAMERNEIAAKGENIGFAISIIEGLKGSLDMEKGGEIARNLDDLYTYMLARLLEANLDNDAGILREIHGLLAGIKESWDAIEPRAGGAPAASGGGRPAAQVAG